MSEVGTIELGCIVVTRIGFRTGTVVRLDEPDGAFFVQFKDTLEAYERDRASEFHIGLVNQKLARDLARCGYGCQCQECTSEEYETYCRDNPTPKYWEDKIMKKQTEDHVLRYRAEGGIYRPDLGSFNKEIISESETLVSSPEVLESKKNDQGKPLMSLIPPYAKEEIAKVLTFGANKYGLHNWNKTGFSYTRLLSACERHLTSFEKGENLDPESGISHLAHAACNLMFLLEQLNNGKGTDDRINS